MKERWTRILFDDLFKNVQEQKEKALLLSPLLL
jgi:hypothetical protein